MRNAGIALLGILFSVGCGSDNSAQLTSVTDMRSVLLYQHVKADRFRLLACPYAVDLDIANDCRNAFLTPDGDDYYFTGIPKQPWLFAPPHETVNKLMTVPIVVGGAVVTWVVLRKLRVKIATDAVKNKKKPSIDVPQAKTVDETVAATDEVAATSKVTKLDAKSYRQQAEKSNTALRSLVGRIEYLGQRNWSLTGKIRGAGGAVKRAIKKRFKKEQPTDSVSYARVAEDIKAELAFMNRQFETLEEAIGAYNESRRYNEIFKDVSFFERIYTIFFGKPKEPSEIFNELREKYSQKFKSLASFFEDGGAHRRLAQGKYDKFTGDMEAVREVIIHGKAVRDGEESFLRIFTRLIENNKVAEKIRASNKEFMEGTEAAKDQVRQIQAEDKAKNENILDYMIATVGGLLAGSYLPGKIPQLEDYLFTKREWKKIFARDDSFKKPLKVADSYTVVKKLARHLKRRGEKVVINEQVFFGLKN